VIRAAAACCLLSLALTAFADDEAARLRDLQREIGAGERRVEEAKAQSEALERKLQRAETELAELQRRDERLGAQIEAAERRLRALAARRAALEATRQRQLRELADDIAIAYRLGRSEPFKILLNLENPQTAQRMMRYYGYLTAARARQLAEYRRAGVELAGLAAQADSENARLQANREDLAQERQRQAAARDKRRELLVALSAQLADERLRVGKLRAEARRLERVLEDLAHSSAVGDAGPFAGRAGHLPWPVAGSLLHRYGESRASTLRWSGWMIAAAEGDPVRAVHAGTVVFADYLRGHGQLIIVDHGDGYLTLYAHNQLLLKGTGNRIDGGEIIARVGSSGGLNQSALYFEIRRGGKTLDPGRWLRKAS
jgi:septal ring factor EnvC (AmiA/AmiB activator)